MRDAQVRYLRIAVKALALPAALGLVAVAYAHHLVTSAPRPCRAPTDYAFVPSGDPGHRTRHAVALHRAGRAGVVVISGAGYGGDSAEVLAELARTLDPDVPLVVENEARSTEENVRNTCARLGPRPTVAIVSDAPHAARVLLTAAKLCPSWDACTAPTPEPPSFEVNAREAARLLGYQITGRASWATPP